MEYFSMKKASKFLVPLVMVLLIAASIGWYLFLYDREFTRDTLLSQARFQDQHGNSRISALFYDAAYSFSGGDTDVAIELANQYKQDGNYTKAELTLTQAIHAGPTAQLYTALCKTFVEQDKLLDAVALLNNVSDPAIKAELDALRPPAPKADREPGFYSEYIKVKLESEGSKYLFYTTDGEYPSIAGALYGTGIPLEAGETTLRAIAVSESGLVSPVTVLGYTVTGVVEKVSFADSAMEAAIRQAISAGASRTLYSNDLWEITEFTAPQGVKTFADLALLPNLTKLTIQDQTIDSLEHLSGLGKLVVLDLSGCKFPVEELEVLPTLSSLSSLTLARCSLSTIEGLEGAQSLTYLDLNNNTVRNLKVLTPMTTLREINLEHNAVTDLSALGTLESLVKLDLSFNAVSSLSPLSGCIRLSHLEVDNNQLSSLSGVEKLPMLSHLAADHNSLTDVSLLGDSGELSYLSLSSNEISDISALGRLTKLTELDFSSNHVEAIPVWPDGCPLVRIDGSYNALSDINSLKNMQQLTHVYMDYNLLTNVDQLADCFCLVQVNVFGNTIGDVSALRDRDIIVNYNPTNVATPVETEAAE